MTLPLPFLLICPRRARKPYCNIYCLHDHNLIHRVATWRTLASRLDLAQPTSTRFAEKRARTHAPTDVRPRRHEIDPQTVRGANFGRSPPF